MHSAVLRFAAENGVGAFILVANTPLDCVTRNGLLVANIHLESKRKDYVPPKVALSGLRRLFHSYGQSSEARYSPKIIHHHDVALLPLSSL
jgi:hypothetical protein